MSERLYLIGDIHGHLDAFREALIFCGANPESGELPEGVHVVQVGDLVSLGPQGLECVQLAERMILGSPGRYVQLWGNHDAHHVGGPDLSDRSTFLHPGERAAGMLQSWLQGGRVRLAVAFHTRELGPLLVSHAGLTAGLWQELDCPEDVHEAARQMDRLLADPGQAFRPGWLHTGQVDRAAGPTWARTGTELAAPWLEEGEMPFSQVHGHEGVWWWPDGCFHQDVPAQVRRVSVIDPDRRTSWVQVEGRRLWSVDPRLTSDWRALGWRPVELQLV